MTRLVWDRVGTRKYESGLDRGVLYLPDGTAVAWNGLTNVVEKSDKGSSPIYFDGMKIGDVVELGDFSATLKAVTYPEEFEELEGMTHIRRGVMVTEQRPQTFALCYRTLIGDDLGEEQSYRIHVLFNVTAIPSEREYASLTDSPEIVEFEWTLTTIPQEALGIRPTSHIIVDTSMIDPWLLEDLETMLYGNAYYEATLIPAADFVTMLREWYRVKILDNGDGTWTAIEQRPGFISFLGPEEFQITNINATYLDPNTYVISDTMDEVDAPRIAVYDNGDGTWTAVTDADNTIVVDEINGIFTINTVDVIFSGPDMYRISSTNTEH